MTFFNPSKNYIVYYCKRYHIVEFKNESKKLFFRLPVGLKAKIWFFAYPTIKQKQNLCAVSAPGIFVKIA